MGSPKPLATLRPVAGSPPPLRARLAARPELADALVWSSLVGAGAAVTVLAVVAGARVGTQGAPFDGFYRSPRLGPASLLAPLVAAAVLAAVRAGIVERLPWRWLLVAAWVSAAAWSVALALVDGTDGLAGPVRDPKEYLVDAGAVATDPVAFVRDFVEHAPGYSVAVRTHPPGATLLVAFVARGVGLQRPAVIGLGVALMGALMVPLAGIAVRSLCHETAGRRLLPVLALAPFALWSAVSLDAVMAAVTAGMMACGVLASEAGRTPRSSVPLAATAGLLLGSAALLGYQVAWLGFSVVAVYFVRRRPALNVVTGAIALVPLGLVSLAGFAWPDGLSVAQADISSRVGQQRSWLLWIVLDLLLLLVACGPTVIAAARGLRRTPGWPFVLGAALAVLFAVVSGLSRGEVERSWLPLFPWLLVPALAPVVRQRQPAAAGAPDAAAVPVGLVALGCVVAVVLQAVLASTW